MNSMVSRPFIPANLIFPLAALLCLFPVVSSGLALCLGLGLALIFPNPYTDWNRKWIHRLLAISITGLGAGMNLGVIGKVGLQGITYTMLGIALTLALGSALGRLLKTSPDTSLLLCVGTAICGGSAIAAVSSAIRAKPQDVSLSLAIVFLLNSIALLIFPPIGWHLHLTQAQFGLWSALAIHDTSSVVGATLRYGPQALEVGTTVKLARALWIVPVSFAIGFWRARKSTTELESSDPSAPHASPPAAKPKKPWFILGFLVAAACVTWIPALREPGHALEWAAKRLLVVTLFLIGSNLNRSLLKSLGLKPLIQGVTLWILVAGGTLTAILQGWISL
ncbi:MAG: putative sulfate exporter family transporter [Methylotenera sp.]|nr:putative sulfate exporter family transporter [Oligoflexia bacterium]